MIHWPYDFVIGMDQHWNKHTRHQHIFQSNSLFTKLWKLAFSTPIFHVLSLSWVLFRTYRGMQCYFSKCKSAELLRIEVLFKSKSVMSSLGACVQKMLSYVTFADWKLKLMSFSLVLDASPPLLTKDAFEQWNIATYIHNICKRQFRPRRGVRLEQNSTSIVSTHEQKEVV